MTNRETLLALAGRVEALSGPCRETDAAIHAALAAIADWDGFPDWIAPDNSPPYTESIDSAMSLVPESHSWRVEHQHGGRSLSYVWPSVPDASAGDAATAPLALTAASLRAIGEGL